MSSKVSNAITNTLTRILAFFLGAGLAFVFFAVVYGIFGILKKDGIASDIAAILAVVLSIAFGLACALAKPKEEPAVSQDQQPEVAGEPAQVDGPAQTEEQPATAVPVGTVKTYKVAGVTHYEQNVMSFAQENPEYNLSKKQLIDNIFMLYDTEKIWKYDFSTPKIELIPEPDNASPQQHRNIIKLREDAKSRYFDAPDLQGVGKNGYRFINAVSDMAYHGKPLRQTKNYNENLFRKTIDGLPVLDKTYQMVLSA